MYTLFGLGWPILWPPRILIFPPGTPCMFGYLHLTPSISIYNYNTWKQRLRTLLFSVSILHSMKWNTWACISIGDWHGQSTSKLKVNSSTKKRDKWTSYSEKDQHYQYKANSSYTKQYSNPYGPMKFSYGGQPPIPTSTSSSAFSPGLSDPFWTHLGT
jgi:outer membrane usher protein FimD/PapC